MFDVYVSLLFYICVGIDSVQRESVYLYEKSFEMRLLIAADTMLKSSYALTHSCCSGCLPAEVKKENQPLVTLPPEKDACADNPCYAGGQCKVDDMLGYRCICPLGRSGPLCNKRQSPCYFHCSFLLHMNQIKKQRELIST